MPALFVTVAHAAEGGSSGMPQFNAATFPSQIFWLILAVVTLHFLLAKIALPRITDILSIREQSIDGDHRRAEELDGRAKALREEIAAHRAETEAGMRRILIESREETDRRIKIQQAQADEQLQKAAEEGEARIRTIREAARADIEMVAREVAAELTDRILPGGPGRDVSDAAVTARLSS